MQVDFFFHSRQKKILAWFVYLNGFMFIIIYILLLMIIFLCSFCRKKKKDPFPLAQFFSEWWFLNVNKILLSYLKPNDNTQFFTEWNTNSFYLFALQLGVYCISFNSFKAGFLKYGPLWGVVLYIGRCLVAFLTSTQYTTSVTHTHIHKHTQLWQPKMFPSICCWMSPGGQYFPWLGTMALKHQTFLTWTFPYGLPL